MSLRAVQEENKEKVYYIVLHCNTETFLMFGVFVVLQKDFLLTTNFSVLHVLCLFCITLYYIVVQAIFCAKMVFCAIRLSRAKASNFRPSFLRFGTDAKQSLFSKKREKKFLCRTFVRLQISTSVAKDFFLESITTFIEPGRYVCLKFIVISLVSICFFRIFMFDYFLFPIF